MEEVMKLLGPWPVLQFIFGIAVLGGGVWAIIRGTQKKDNTSVQIEDKRVEWEAMELLRSIDRNTEKVAENQRIMLENVRGATEQIRYLTEQMKALAAAIWNRGV